MNIKNIIALLLVSLLVFAGCSTQSVSQDDNTIVLERYGMFTLPEYQFQKVIITKNNITFETFGPDMNRTGIVSNNISEEKFNSLLQVFNEFETFDKKYTSDVPIADIGAGNITYKDHEIVIDPYVAQGNPQKIASIVNTLNDFIATNVKFPESPQEPSDVTTLEYRGKACVDEPWEVWYSEGNINYAVEPTQEQLIVDHYASKNISIETIQTLDAGPTCKACEVCADSVYFEIEVTSSIDELQEEGWVIIE